MKSSPKKVLFISSRLPYPPLGGDRIRMGNISFALGRNFKTDVYSLVDKHVSRQEYADYKKNFNEVSIRYIPKYLSYRNVLFNLLNHRPLQVAYYYFSRVKKEILAMIKRNAYDLIFCSHIRTTEFIKDIDIPKVVDLVDSISLNYLRSRNTGSSLMWRLIYLIEKQRVLSYEAGLPCYFDYCFTTSRVDTEHLKKISGRENILTIANGVSEELLNCTADHEEEDIISFLGKMSYNPNVNAVIYFADEIWPRVKEKISNARFFILGIDPSDRVKGLSKKDKDIVVTGFVKNPYEILSRSKLIVAPMISGAGTQYKILEAMALGKCVITTTFGAAGIEGENGIHFIVRDSPDEFADEVLRLWYAKSERDEIGRNAKDLILQKYKWQKTTEKMIETINNLIL